MSFTLGQPYADLKVLGLVADMAACGYYRVEYPLEFLRRGGAQADTAAGVSIDLIQHYDVVIAQRCYNPQLFAMLQEARRLGKVVVYELDDYLHGVHPDSPAYSTFRPGCENLKWVEKFMQGTDALFVSTPELAGEYSSHASRTWVIPNGLDFGIRNWDVPAPRDPRLQGKTVIGWAGSSFHPDDNLPLIGSLARVLRENPNAVFAICSGPQQVIQFLKPLGLPADQVVGLEPMHFWDYPQLLTQFDIGIAPLANTRFNRSKSELKLLEMGAWGIPYVASKTAPYNRFHLASQGHGGYLAENQRAWEERLTQLVQDDQDRKERGEFMREHVRENYSIERTSFLWAGCLRQARDMARYNPQVKLQHAAQARKPGRNDKCPCSSGRKYKVCCTPAFG